MRITLCLEARMGILMKKTRSYNPLIYKEIGIDQLVVLSVHRILESGEDCTFERLVYECFTLFPESFSLIRYPDWPDSARINKAWLRCRTDKGWLSGSTKEGFRLTSLGHKMALETQEILGIGSSTGKKKRRTKPREKHEAIVEYILNSATFKKYGNNNELSITDIISFLGGTLETPKRILRQNLNLYFDAVRIYNRIELLPFLEYCKARISKLKD